MTRKKQILTFGKVKVTQNVAQYPMHHVTYAPANFELLQPMLNRRRCIYKKRDGGTTHEINIHFFQMKKWSIIINPF